MYKRNSSLPNFSVKDNSRKRNSSAPEIHYSKADEDKIEIRFVDAHFDLIDELNAQHRHGQVNILPKGWGQNEKLNTDSNDKIISSTIQHQQHLNSGMKEENFEVIGVENENDRRFGIPVMANIPEDKFKEFDTASDIDIRRKGMAKGHYVDKNLRNTCYGCQKQFKLKRKPKHCRRCGEVFCLKCVKYRQKLNVLANPDPEGKSRKVCKACIEGDSLILGCTRCLTDEFSNDRSFAKYARMISKRVNSLTTTFWPDQSEDRSSRRYISRSISSYTESTILDLDEYAEDTTAGFYSTEWSARLAGISITDDKIDRQAECMRLVTGFQTEVKQLGSSNALQALKVILKTPSWQKSNYWDIEIQATKCRACKGDVGLRKSTGNCRVCGLALCRKCSHKELLLFYENGETTEDARLAIIHTQGVQLYHILYIDFMFRYLDREYFDGACHFSSFKEAPSHEPDISLLLYVCLDCKTHISEQQQSNLLWYTRRVERSIVDDILVVDSKFKDLKGKITVSMLKIEEFLDKASGSELTSVERRSASAERTTLRTTLNMYEKDFKHVRSWLNQALTRTQTTLLENYFKSKYDFYMDQRYKCRALGNKLDAGTIRNEAYK